jgi:hypothetical protein
MPMGRMNITRTLAAVLAGIALATPSVPVMFDLPAPSGPHRVGTTSWHVTDGSRRETLAAADAAREVEVLAWYPTSAREGTAAPATNFCLATRRQARCGSAEH